jgi:ATP-dependent RNA circularization protein (DNA/RNA ligase family)
MSVTVSFEKKDGRVRRETGTLVYEPENNRVVVINPKRQRAITLDRIVDVTVLQNAENSN